MKSYNEYIDENIINENIDDIKKSDTVDLKNELTPEEEIKIDKIIDDFVTEYLNNYKELNENENLSNIDIDNLISEGVIGTILGGLTGFALGSTIGKIFAKVLGVNKGAFYDLLTSRLVGTAIGAALGGR